MIRLKNLSLLALLCLLRGKGFKRVCVLVLLLGLVFVGRSFAGVTNWDNIGLHSDTTIGLPYIAMFERVDQTDSDFISEPVTGDGSFSRTATRTLAGWIIIYYSPGTTYWELAFMTPGVFNSVTGYIAIHEAGSYEGLDTLYSKQQVYDPNTGEIYVPVENQSPISVH